MQGCKRAYQALVRPLLEFSVPVWSPYQRKDADALEKVQKRAACWICASWDQSTYSWTMSYEECSELRWPSLQSRHDVLTCCQVYKIIHKLDYTDFSHCFSFTPLSHSRFHNLTLFCKPSRINVYRHCFFISFPMPTPTTHLSQSNISSLL